mmetsp:Transcript_13861/g.23091  ORF Transcript_13861/g.23091 Transcript_13861/m.23091 type:complete len:195 (+) Transcript_13861:74-658(+)|eukprot:CAMPEP_0174996632 /NCGR_PEP_ID=MMETSP0005-20121125/507_1 /TAXON_ID=420556 /ORGANISM="Ochromonas sp., Strain CCMP1393" /LENGTH=194 /DNA_ID=CAMNT_0016251071 /DNA_START=57 /DNA_END=641 /DNA_ORIENTATION=+
MATSPSKIPRSYSDKFVSGSSEYDLFKNKNIDWIGGPFTHLCYVIVVLALWGLIHISTLFPAEDCWTVTNVIHGVVTFIMLHWIKGCPDDSTQGEYNGLTLYEQIDAGVPWTSSKKFLILVPTLLCLVACFTADYKPFYIVVNCGIMLICVVGKMPQMHRVRIFGINSTPGIDQPIEYSPPSGSVSKHKSKKHM